MSLVALNKEGSFNLQSISLVLQRELRIVSKALTIVLFKHTQGSRMAERSR